MSNNAGPVLRHGGKQEGGSQQPPFYPAIDMDVYLSRDDRVAIRNKLYPDTPGKRPVQTAHLIPVFVSLCTLISLGATRNRLSIIDVFDQLLARLRDNKAETRLDDLNISVRDGPVQPATVWRILSSMTGLPAGLPLPTGDVRTHVQALFSRDENSSPFSVSMIDLMAADLTFVPTTKLTEHLTLDGRRVKVLQLDGQRARFFHSFHENQLANALGLSRLGQEVLASIWALLDKDIDMIPVAEELGFIKISNDFEREFLQLSFQDLPTTTNAEILGARVTELKQLVVKNRKSKQMPVPLSGLGDSASVLEKRDLKSSLSELILPSPDEMDELSRVLFEEPMPPNLAHFHTIAFGVRNIQREHQLSFEQIVDFTKCFLKFLEDHRGATKTLSHLINHYTQTVADASPQLQKLEIVSRLVNTIVMFPPTEQLSGMETGLMHAFHQIFPQGNEYTPFADTFNIADLVKTKFDIVPTESLSQHLIVEGNTVKIFKITQISDVALVVYGQNRAVRMLQLSSLGGEVLTSLATLVDGHGLREQGEKLGFISYDAKNEGGKLVIDMLLSNFNQTPKAAKPNLLAGRLVHLNNLVKRRKRWWVSLGHNIMQQRSEQPFIFTVTVLGVLFGACSIVQTVFSA